MTETALLLQIQNWRSETLDAVMYWYSAAGDNGLVWLILAVLLILFSKTRKTGSALMLALFMHFVAINLCLKPYFDRLRPCEVLTPDNMLLACLHDGSFPSGHTSAAFAAAAVIFCTNKPLGVLFFALATLMGFTRLYLFVHYPSDVVAGALCGTLFGLLAYRFFKYR